MDEPLYHVPNFDNRQHTGALNDTASVLYPPSDASFTLKRKTPELRKDVVDSLREIGFETLQPAGNGYSRNIYLTNGAIILSIENADISFGRCCVPAVLQPLCEPFTIHKLSFEILPYVLPAEQAPSDISPENASNISHSVTSHGCHTYFDTKDANRGVLLTGDQLFIDPGVVRRCEGNRTQEMTLQEFWSADLSLHQDPLLVAQHQHLKELSKQVGYELQYGEWPTALISKERLGMVIEKAMERHCNEHVSEGEHKGKKRPFCDIIREEIASDPTARNWHPAR